MNNKATHALALGILMACATARAQQPPAGGPPQGNAPQGERDMGPASKGGMPAPATTYEVDIHMQASAPLYQKWPGGGTTWHYGKGFIGPFGGAEYYCGENFPEARQYPLTDSLKGFFEKYTGKPDALFCVYRTKDGDFYVYDSVAGMLNQNDSTGGGRNVQVNLVVDGSGAYKGATGIWLGLTEGTGKATEVAPGRRLPEVLMKIMNGYVKVPNAK
jgi:hypothetical protein